MSVLKRICAEPANLELRLVYADQLSERGDPRGTFIAQQCQLSRTDPLDVAYAPLFASTRRLEAKHAATWLGNLTPPKPGDFSRLEVSATFNAVFKNGFLYRIATTEEDLASRWKTFSEREPIAGVELLVGESVERVERPEAAGFRALKLSPDSWFTANSVGSALAWGMPLLEDVDLSGCDLGPTGARLLVNLETDLGDSFEGWRAPPPFRNGQLKHLVLHGCGLHDEGALLLFGAESLVGLRTLTLSQCRLTQAATLDALKRSPHLVALTDLSLSGNKELGGHFTQLSGWEALPKLERLALPQTVMANDVRALFPSPSKALRELDLTSAKALLTSPAAVLALAEAFTSLDLGLTAVGDDGWAELMPAPALRRLVELHANGCSLSDDAVEVLTTKGPGRLVTLDLSSNKLTDDGLTTLAEWPGLEHVTQLRLGNNRKVTAAGYRALMKAPSFAPAMLDVGKAADVKLIAALKERFGPTAVIASSK